MKIHLHIERLVLDGLPVEQPQVLRRALEADLAGRFMEGGLSAELRAQRSARSVTGGAVRVEQRPDSARLGAQIAGAVYHGIGAKK